MNEKENEQDQFEADNPANQQAIQCRRNENTVSVEALADLAMENTQAEVTKGGSGTARYPALFNAKGTTNV